MNTGALGDMAKGYMLRKQSTALQQDMQRLTAELTSGQVSNVRDAVAGNYSFLTDVERKTEVLASYDIATSEAAQFTASMQLALGNFTALAKGLSGSLMAAGTSSTASNGVAVASDARATLDGMVGTLNTNAAGRNLFSGNATDQRPLVDSATLLADLSTAMAGAATAADMMAAAQTWFDDPAGFAALAYQGGTQAMADFTLSPNETAGVDVRGDDPGFARALRGAAVAALATDPAFGLSDAEQANLFTLAGQDLLTGQDDLVRLESKVGFVEARIDAAATRNAAEVASLNMARNTLLEADPFEVATKLEEVQFQLQSLYSLTVRSSQLSLLNYL